MNNQYLKHGLFENKYLLLSLIAGIFIQTIVAIVPTFATCFKLVPLNVAQWAISIGISLLPIPIMELQKRPVLLDTFQKQVERTEKG